ncbi:MAG: hypothetical protein ACD_75C00822G0006 [uncultured bacterium]|nr:MAG: hypothetical protein ACD_75C00822G0006 [uncultured bacterium]
MYFEKMLRLNGHVIRNCLNRRNRNCIRRRS